MLVKCCLSQSELSNCESDINDVLLNVFAQRQDISTCTYSSVPDLRALDLDPVNVNISDLVCDKSLPMRNAVVYVAGYTCRKYLLKYECDECSALLRVNSPAENREDRMFLSNKSYTGDVGKKCGLFVPSDNFVHFISECENIFASNFMSLMHMSKICDRLCSVVMSNVDLTWFTASNCIQNVSSIIRSYVTMRIFYTVKFFNISLSEQPRNKRNRKALKLEYM